MEEGALAPEEERGSSGAAGCGVVAASAVGRGRGRAAPAGEEQRTVPAGVGVGRGRGAPNRPCIPIGEKKLVNQNLRNFFSNASGGSGIGSSSQRPSTRESENVAHAVAAVESETVAQDQEQVQVQSVVDDAEEALPE
ncbi:unnamed protein product, partial [Urochloa humidicola]